MILGIDTSAKVAACAVYDNGKVKAQGFINNGNTHSQTLLPLIKKVLSDCGCKVSDMDIIAVSAGPGSFTGVRIGVSMAKGLAHAAKKQCVSVSTLESLAYNLIDKNVIVCAVMDAKCNQVYNANFMVKEGAIERLCQDRALYIDELLNELSCYNNVVLVGDGAELVYSFVQREGLSDKISLAEEDKRLQSGVSVCLAAVGKESISPAVLMPVYLRLPQAERERLAKVNE